MFSVQSGFVAKVGFDPQRTALYGNLDANWAFCNKAVQSDDYGD
jgi:hypothetical protein